MKKLLYVLILGIFTGSIFFGRCTAEAATQGKETVTIGQSVSYTGTETPGYTFDSEMLSGGATVGAMIFNISVDLPASGDVSWNDWCGEALAVRTGDNVKYYDFGGAQVGWGTDMTGDNVADTSGVNTISWVGSVSSDRTCTIVVPINAEDFTVDFYDNCWDSAADINHYTINSATALYGELASVESLAVNEEMSYTGTKGEAGYTFDSSVLTTEGTVSAVAINVSVALPTEGDVTWNDWCGEALSVKIGDEVKYYDFGGAQVGWGTDMTGDDVADTTGVNTESWVGSCENRSISLVIPIEAEDFVIELFDNCWDSAADIPHLRINSVAALFGSITGSAVALTPTPTPVPADIPDFDADGTYHAYFGIQSSSYAFRNPWSDPSFGANGTGWDSHDEGNCFDALIFWDNSDILVQRATINDREIAGNGTYKVSLEDFDFGNDTSFNTLFVSTDIPLEGNNLTFTNVKVKMDGSTKYVFDDAVIAGIDTSDVKDYYEIHCINIWNNSELGGSEGLFSYPMPARSIEIEFTVSGFSYDKAVEAEPTQAVEVSSADEGNSSPNYFVIVAVIVVAVIIIAGVIVVIRKRKNK